VKKESINNIKQKGFDSLAQMRFLLHLAREHPEKYSFVFDILKEHGVPKKEKVDPAYWKGPYKVSPDTPSYIYTGRSATNNLEKLIRIAQHLDDMGNLSSSTKLDKVVRRTFLQEELANRVANMFWTIRKDEVTNDPSELAKWFNRLENFEPYKKLDSATQQEVERKLGDKILGR
jgi:hypothetical protein